MLTRRRSSAVFFGISASDETTSETSCRTLCNNLFFLKVLLKIMFVLKVILVVCCGRVARNCRSRSEFRVLVGIKVARGRIHRAVGSRMVAMFFLPLITTKVRATFTFPVVRGVIRLLTFSSEGFLVLIAIYSCLMFTLFCVVICVIASGRCCGVIDKGRRRDLFSWFGR